MANIPEFISILRRIRDVIYPRIEVIYENTAILESQAKQSKNAAAASAAASASSAGLATTRANEIKNVSAQTNTLSSGSLATVSYNSTDGKFTFGIPVGEKGDKGESYTINASGTTAGRAAYDKQLVGFSYLDISLSIVYFKLSAASGDWSTGTSFGRGEDGANGADGTGITSISFYSTTSDNGLASQQGGIDTYRITLSNSNTYDISLTNGSELNINGYGDKVIPGNDDEIAIADSNSSFNLKKLSIKNLKSSLNTGFKNYIINGNFDIWQRGIYQTSSSYGSDDRWINMNNGSTKTHARIACTNTERALFNASHFSRTVVSSVAGANNYVQKVQRIEDITRLSGKTVTLSFWAKADTAKNIGFRVGYDYGSGGTPSNGIDTGAQLIGITPTWQKKSITLPLTSLVGKTLGTDGVHTSSLILVFVFDEGSSISSTGLGQQSGIFDIAQVQLEEGSVATPFEQRPYGLELSLCQRYYEVGSGTILCSSNTQAFLGAVNDCCFKVSKRIPPTLTATKTSGTLEGIEGTASVYNIILTPSMQGVEGQFAYYNWTASSEL